MKKIFLGYQFDFFIEKFHSTPSPTQITKIILKSLKFKHHRTSRRKAEKVRVRVRVKF